MLSHITPPPHAGGGAAGDPSAAGRRPLLFRAGLAALFLALFYLCWLFPVTGDDWFREELGRNLHGLPDLIQAVADRWQGSNARILGNILAYSAGGRKLLRELLRAAILTGTVCAAARLAGFRSFRGVLLAAAALLALPRELFAQSYPWAAGFFNYVPPVLMLLTAFWLLRAVFEEEPVPDGLPRTIAVFLLGFGGQLFMENDTLYALWAGAVLLIWQLWRQRKPSRPAAAFFLGTLLGAAALFLSPSYRLILAEDSGYETGLTQGLAGLLETARENQAEVLRWLISGCPVLYVLLTALGVLWFARSARRLPDWCALSLLILGALYFLFCYASGTLVRLNPLVVPVWGLALGLGCWRWLPKGGRRCRALFFWAGSAVAAFPLLFVQPIGPRCLYLSYVLLLLTGGCMLTALPLERLPLWLRRSVPALLALLVLGWYLRLFLPIHSAELTRAALLEQAVEQGQTQVAIPAFPHGEYLWEPDSDKITSRYYLLTPGDLKVSFLPFHCWDAEGTDG